jgi:hypothetical protein
MPMPVSKKAPHRRSLQDSLAGVAQRAQQNKEKIRVEGFALGDDKDRVAESLKRANLVRDRLLQNGLTSDQIEVVATGRAAQGDAVRIMAVQNESKPQQPTSSAALPGKPASEEPLGNAFFLSATPLTIEKGRSALVSMLSHDVDGQTGLLLRPDLGARLGEVRVSRRRCSKIRPTTRSMLGRSRSTPTDSSWAKA